MLRHMPPRYGPETPSKTAAGRGMIGNMSWAKKPSGTGLASMPTAVTGLATGWRYVPNRMSHSGVTPPKFESCSSRANA